VTRVRQDLEEAISEKLEAADWRGAAERLIRGYGPEVLGFLYARTRSDDLATEAFSEFCEDLWRGLPGFERRCSARVWAFTLARHAALRVQAAPERRAKWNVALSQLGEISALAERVRTETAPHFKTENKERVLALRDQLSEEEQTLLILRVDKGLEWKDIAVVLSDGSTSADPIDGDAARWRKRFQLVKARLRRMAKAQGLLE
jgi:RNA polymerase sigma-70 factor (ECF subfamily)